MHEEPGPLKELVNKLLLAGKRNARLATAVALHLSGLILDCPAVGQLYQIELLQMMLTDSKAAEATHEVVCL